MPKLRNGKQTKPVKPKPCIKKEKVKTLNDVIIKAEKDAKEKKETNKELLRSCVKPKNWQCWPTSVKKKGMKD